LTDRLILEFSTNEIFNNKYEVPCADFFYKIEDNYNQTRGEIYYDLRDKLCDDVSKKGVVARKTRGLTGWVAVTGIPLIVNSSRNDEVLEDMIKENPAAESKCFHYGYPMWGHRVSELPNAREWSRRYMAVPIFSQINKSKAIGVIRYASPINSRKLTHGDLLFLESVADLVSAINNVKQVKILCSREGMLEKENLAFEKFGDISEYLLFLCQTLRSRISSLYINLNINGKPILRLLDAYGISGLTGDLRTQLKDYSAEDSGLTYHIFKSRELKPVKHASVLKGPLWSGKNTKIFYGKALGELSVPDLETNLENKEFQKALLSRHPINLLGFCLQEKNFPVGVIKVEFPSTYDDSQHYNQSDKDFLEKCSEVLSRELHQLQSFINLDWFEKAGSDNVISFVRHLSQISRYNLIADEDNAETFWVAVKDFSNKYKYEIEKHILDNIGLDMPYWYVVLLKEIIMNKTDKQIQTTSTVRGILISRDILKALEAL